MASGERPKELRADPLCRASDGLGSAPLSHADVDGRALLGALVGEKRTSTRVEEGSRAMGPAGR